MYKKLHPKLPLAKPLLPSDVGVALFTRHSIREEAVIATYDLPLTQEGRKLAAFWGEQQSLPIVKAYSSPVQRCIDTAQLMIKSHAAKTVEETSLLTEPGCYVQDMIQVAGLFLKSGPQHFTVRLLNNNLRGVLSAQEGAKQLLTWFKSQMGLPGTLTLHVSHDTILATLVYFLLNKKDITETQWPWMMEGVYLWFCDEQVLFVWRGKKYSAPFN